MNRRGFLHSLVGGIAATAAVRTWPFRVYSFPSEIQLPTIATSTATGTLALNLQGLPLHRFATVWYNPEAQFYDRKELGLSFDILKDGAAA
jgi:hypothetical protein